MLHSRLGLWGLGYGSWMNSRLGKKEKKNKKTNTFLHPYFIADAIHNYGMNSGQLPQITQTKNRDPRLHPTSQKIETVFYFFLTIHYVKTPLEINRVNITQLILFPQR